MGRTLVTFAVLSLLVGGCGGAAEPLQVSDVTFDDVNEKFGVQSNRTDLQKEREWRAYEGLCVEWAGELTSLSAGLFGGFNIQFKHLPTTFVSDVLVHAPSSAEEELLTWRASVDRSNPAICGHRKSGHFRRPETGVDFYFRASFERKAVWTLVRQLRGPHLSTWA